jgi:hypothetical protein
VGHADGAGCFSLAAGHREDRPPYGLREGRRSIEGERNNAGRRRGKADVVSGQQKVDEEGLDQERRVADDFDVYRGGPPKPATAGQSGERDKSAQDEA